MARKAQGRISGRIVRMIPTSYGNADDLSPVVVTYRVPSERERRELTVHGEAVIARKKGEEFEIEMPAGDELAKKHEAIRRMVVKVENYTAPDGSAIDDGAKLSEHGEMAFVYEVAAAVMSSVEIEEDAAKKSVGSPASGSVATLPLDGTAASASAKGGTAIGTVTATVPISGIALALPG